MNSADERHRATCSRRMRAVRPHELRTPVPAKGDDPLEQRGFPQTRQQVRPLRDHGPHHARGVPRALRRALPRAGLARRRTRQRRDRQPAHRRRVRQPLRRRVEPQPALARQPARHRARGPAHRRGGRLRHRARPHAHRRVRDALRAAHAPGRRAARPSSTPPTASTSTRAARRPATRSTRASSASPRRGPTTSSRSTPRTSRPRARSAGIDPERVRYIPGIGVDTDALRPGRGLAQPRPRPSAPASTSPPTRSCSRWSPSSRR